MKFLKSEDMIKVFYTHRTVMNGRCCGIAPRILKDNKWTCSECDGIIESNYIELDFSDVFNGYDYGPKPKECECGADTTYGTGSNTHATYCPLYKK